MKKIMFWLVSLLFMLSASLVSLNSCETLRKTTDVFVDVGEVFTETAIKKLFGSDFSFQKDSVNLEKTFERTQIVSIFGDKISRKLTYNGTANVITEKVNSFIKWEASPDKKNIKITLKRKRF